MYALHDDIRNLSAVLDLLQAHADAVQRPVLRLMGDHLRLLAGQLAPASVQDIWPAPLCPAPHGVPSLPAQALTEACRVPQ
ncbi:hypothetical protein [Desulfovibrio legallii]|uniref:Uncharacterized protein n=1 Tax=Desulfovibrio legallii TaxID=571438 RepID=A0A1G7KVV0_9BACT|nr:hypothetical protein [Desulfovibrio legallii]SDF41204.1 hypothetical protein SAMN05192586_10515 [Desulfovibrio legallii]